MDNKKIGELIAKLRKEKRLTQQELGDKVGVGSRAVSKWECGITIPDISIINELSKILGISSDELLSGKQNKPNKTINSETKKSISTKIKIIIVISILLLLTAIVSQYIYIKNKTYVYTITETEHEKYKVEGYATYKNGMLSIYINNFNFNQSTNIKFPITAYQYRIKFNNKIILGYVQTSEDDTDYKNEILSDFEKIIKINYTGKTNLSNKEILNQKIILLMTIMDKDNKEYNYDVEMEMYKKER